MWDVKKDKMVKEKDTKKSFTLTMWDVKFNRSDYSIYSHPSFTLTMWDVKSFITAEGLFQKIKVLP